MKSGVVRDCKQKEKELHGPDPSELPSQERVWKGLQGILPLPHLRALVIRFIFLFVCFLALLGLPQGPELELKC